METLELPATKEADEIQSWPELPPVDIAKQEMDIAAFQLWRDASRVDNPTEQDSGDAKA